jgi:hypothetical protein
VVAGSRFGAADRAATPGGRPRRGGRELDNRERGRRASNSFRQTAMRLADLRKLRLQRRARVGRAPQAQSPAAGAPAVPHSGAALIRSLKGYSAKNELRIKGPARISDRRQGRLPPGSRGQPSWVTCAGASPRAVLSSAAIDASLVEALGYLVEDRDGRPCSQAIQSSCPVRPTRRRQDPGKWARRVQAGEASFRTWISAGSSAPAPETLGTAARSAVA